MKNFIYLLIGFLLIIFSGSIFNLIDIPVIDVRADFLFLYLVFLALFIGSERAGVIGLFLGLITDIFIGRYHGFYGLIFFVAGIAYGMFKDKIFKEKPGGAVLLMLLGSLIKNVLSILFFKTAADSWVYVGIQLVFILTLNLFIGLIVYYPIRTLIYKVEK